MTTQNDHKKSRNPMEMVSEVIFRLLGLFFWSFRAFFGHFCPILAPNSKLLQTSHVTTQNDRKRSRNPMEMVSDVTFQTFRPISVIWGTFRPFLANFGPKLKIVVNWSCDHSKWPQERQKSTEDGFIWQFQWVQVISGHLVSFWGQKWLQWAPK